MVPAGVAAAKAAGQERLAAGAGSLEARRTRRLLHAVETFKARCAARGETATEDDNWLVLLSALRAGQD